MFFQALALGILAGLAQWDSRMFGQNMLDRPLVVGPIVGLILGDFQTGIIMGGSLELVWMGLVNIGGATPPDMVTGGILGTAYAILSGLDTKTAIAVALPIAILAQSLGIIARVINTTLNSKADTYAKNGNDKGIEHLLWFGAAVFFILSFIPVFLGIFFGADLVREVVKAIPQNILTGLQMSAGILPALGIAVLMRFIYDKDSAPYLFIGFILAAVLKMSMVSVSIIGASVAYVTYRNAARENKISFSSNSESSSEKPLRVLDRRTFYKTIFRSLALQGAFNYERMQGIGFCFTVLPALRKIYPDKKDLAEALKRHVVFFNTSPQFVTFIVGIVVAMEEENAAKEDFDPSAIGAIKAALMGPLAGIGDSFFWGTIRIIGAGIGVGLALKGNILGAILFILIYNIPHYILRFGGLKLGYTGGMQFIQKAYATGLFEKLTASAKLLGTFVVGAMIATMVQISTPLVFTSNGAKTVLQDTFNNVLPAMLPLGLTFLVYWLVKRGIKVDYIMLGLMVFGVVGVLVGVL
ncbi:PTS system mannose/fructose/sorbose family transporter subunit IID [Pediococcus ethanolidurans]|uniref:PTS system mannose-specific transporter subunit IICD n=1 Tax=Pediococcus ethanolidurans TaxID=319653 RepID=A0A0R2KBH9_9LACO|nr:PTS system mannose/fructose/sorbose family transporter subunit IID [Pediococcus ethanolidurans]KRN83629.1 PTS system mannose-specific transporter subunit IICD [Pediococcus ethanolidurans]GEN94016.1 hypothetical protein PET01_00660 [Pediococcus ethanolidurans]SER01967.1 PTS system, mannose-specific IID component [Pediococcus ethanolidurans]